MADYIKNVLVLAIGLTIGLAASAEILSGPAPFDRVRLGPWEIAAQAGSVDADPYQRASLVRSGEMPLAVGEGLQLIAHVDDDGRPLDSRCSYEVGPHVPEARYWTLTLTDPKGWPIDNPAARYGFRSSEILRLSSGDFAIRVSAEAEPGNWLPVGKAGLFALVLNLYDSPLGPTASEIDRAVAPGIRRLHCK